MAILHEATLSPTKDDVLRDLLNARHDVDGGVERLGAYRYDDPAGEVGIEAHIVECDGRVFHVPLTYRGAPLDGVEPICTMSHSVLGDRWVYAATDDRVAVAAYTSALRGDQQQAVLELHRADGAVESPATDVAVSATGDAAPEAELRFTDDMAAPVTGDATLVAVWSGGSAVVAALG